MGRSVNFSVVAFVVAVLFIQNIVVLFSLHNNGGMAFSSSSQGDDAGIFAIQKTTSESPYLHDQTNVPIPSHIDGSPMSIEERLRYLELKANAFMQFGTDPFFQALKTSKSCKNMSNLEEWGCKAGDNCNGLYDHWVCLDQLPNVGTKYEASANPPCLIYDFGIRSQPHFGEVMARKFGCEVHAFDPSPISKEWWAHKDTQGLRDLPNYHFHPYGSGGTDGTIVLQGYNWGQVSILRYPTLQVNCKNKTDKDTHCHYDHHDSQKFFLPVKTLPTIIKELGHEGREIDILKIDVEGSEYSFLENLFDSTGGCPSFIQQVSLEWHHFGWDTRYGEGSSPSINTIVTLLHACGLKTFWMQ